MRRPLLTLLLYSGLACTAPHAQTTSRLTDIKPIPLGNSPVTLHPSGFPEVTITPLWRENGNAWSHHLYAVTTRDTEQPSPAHIRVYQLTQGDGEPGSTPFYFALRTTLASPVTTYHADIALSAATKIPFARWNADQEPAPTCPQ
ncbi:hypothetical protein [Gluconobacter oxydans]|uniref:hypothetical protein n=1 Tax=Gluconobacter oxydans TaxID=442 RepID=UPI0039EAFBDA